MKNCSNRHCEQTNPQPNENFSKNPRVKSGLNSRCKACCKKYQSAHYVNNKAYYNARISTWKKSNIRKVKSTVLKNRYGLTLDEYNLMLEAQNNSCAICETKTYGGRSKKYFYVDHCHKTGKIRGLLCSKCNFAIGYFNDSIPLIERALKYLENHL